MTIMYCAAHPDEKYDSPDDWLRERYVQREEPGLHGVARGSDPGGYGPDITEKIADAAKISDVWLAMVTCSVV